MAKIPGEAPRPIPTPSRRLPSGSGGAGQISRAAGMFSRYADTAGSGFEALGAGLLELDKANLRQQESDARARWLTGIASLDEKYAADPGDPSTMRQRYEGDLKVLSADISNGLDKRLKDSFAETVNVESARSLAGVTKQALNMQRDQTRAWMDESLDKARRGYLTGETEEQRETATKAGLAAIDKAVTYGAISQEEAGTRRRDFISGTLVDWIGTFSDAEQIAILGNDKHPANEIIDPAVRADLLKRARRRQEVTIRDNVADAVTVLEAGKTPANLDSVRAMAKGTEYASALKQAEQDRDTLEEFSTLPITEQRSVLSRFNDKETATAREVRIADKQGKIFARNLRALSQGQGLLLAGEAGIIGLTPIDPMDPASLRERAAQAQIASAWAGVPVSPLLPDEQAALKEALDSAAPSEVTSILASLHGGLGREQAVNLAGAVSPTRPDLAVAIALAPDLPTVSRDIVTGQRIIAKNPEARPGKAEHMEALDTVAGNLFTPESASTMDAFLAAADALYANSYVTGEGDFQFDPDAYEEALRTVMGGPFEFNDRVILPPAPGMDEDAFSDRMEAMTQPDLIEYGNGVPMLGDDPFTVDLFDRGLFHEDAQLVSAGFGKYAVYMPGLGAVMTDKGETYILDLRAMLDVQ